MHIRILTPDKEIVSTQADMVVGKAVDGAVSILPGHTAYTTVLRSAPLLLIRGESEESHSLEGGLLQVTKEGVTIFADRLVEEQSREVSS